MALRFGPCPIGRGASLEMRGVPEVLVYSKSWCPFCTMAKQLLGHKGVSYREIDVEVDRDREAEMIERSGGRRTVPQLFIGGRHIGGYDDLAALDGRGELDPLLESPTGGEG